MSAIPAPYEPAPSAVDIYGPLLVQLVTSISTMLENFDDGAVQVLPTGIRPSENANVIADPEIFRVNLKMAEGTQRLVTENECNIQVIEDAAHPSFL